MDQVLTESALMRALYDMGQAMPSGSPTKAQLVERLGLASQGNSRRDARDPLKDKAGKVFSQNDSWVTDATTTRYAELMTELARTAFPDDPTGAVERIRKSLVAGAGYTPDVVQVLNAALDHAGAADASQDQVIGALVDGLLRRGKPRGGRNLRLVARRRERMAQFAEALLHPVTGSERGDGSSSAVASARPMGPISTTGEEHAFGKAAGPICLANVRALVMACHVPHPLHDLPAESFLNLVLPRRTVLQLMDGRRTDSDVEAILAGELSDGVIRHVEEDMVSNDEDHGRCLDALMEHCRLIVTSMDAARLGTQLGELSDRLYEDARGPGPASRMVFTRVTRGDPARMLAFLTLACVIEEASCEHVFEE